MVKGLLVKKSESRIYVLKGGFGYLSGLPNHPSHHSDIADAQTFSSEQEAREIWEKTPGSGNPAVRMPQIIEIGS